MVNSGYCQIMDEARQGLVRQGSVRIDAEAIRTRRQDLGISQAGLAERCGISPPYLCQIERERRKTVSPKVFKRLYETLGVKPKALRKVA